MPFHTVRDTDVTYALIIFDREGVERRDDAAGIGGRMSARVIEFLQSEPFTDVFVVIHGWKGDVPAAIAQYDRWFTAMADATADVTQATRRIAGFRPLRIGLHWPSLPWGDEEQPGAGIAFYPATAVPAEQMIERYVERLGDSPEIRDSLQVIFRVARTKAAADRLPPEAEAAYRRLNEALRMGEAGEGAAPGDDRERFDPQAAFDNGNEEAVFGGEAIFGGILGPLRQLSFWKMKQRARDVGEEGMHEFLVSLQQKTSARKTRIHVMGHSFGCIVASAMVNGAENARALVRPIDSLALIQGALSLWSYCPDIPDRRGTPGYFHEIVSARKVRGPIVTTQSVYDSAVGRLYPIAAGVAGQADFAPGRFPTYGGLGAFGVRGLSSGVVDLQMLAADVPYPFAPGTIYNLESSKFIANGVGSSGAHNDISGAEVAHAIWQAALV